MNNKNVNSIIYNYLINPKEELHRELLHITADIRNGINYPNYSPYIENIYFPSSFLINDVYKTKRWVYINCDKLGGNGWVISTKETGKRNIYSYNSGDWYRRNPTTRYNYSTTIIVSEWE